MAAQGEQTLVLCTGGRTETGAMALLPDLPEVCFVEVGDFTGAALRARGRARPDRRGLRRHGRQADQARRGRPDDALHALQGGHRAARRDHRRRRRRRGAGRRGRRANTARHAYELWEAAGLLPRGRRPAVPPGRARSCERFAEAALDRARSRWSTSPARTSSPRPRGGADERMAVDASRCVGARRRRRCRRGAARPRSPSAGARRRRRAGTWPPCAAPPRRGRRSRLGRRSRPALDAVEAVAAGSGRRARQRAIPGSSASSGRCARARAARSRCVPAVSSVARAFARPGCPGTTPSWSARTAATCAPAVNACRAHPKVAVLTAPGAGPAELGAGAGRLVAARLSSPSASARRTSASRR